MATSSIFQTVYIKDKKKVKQFIVALEKSKQRKSKDVHYSRPVEQITEPEKIRKIFGEGQCDRLQNHHD